MTRIDGIVKLRKLTGLPFKLCKDVFDKHGGNIPTSLDYLKKCGEQFEPFNKSLTNGVVFTYSDNNIFGLFSMKCVTDFAARSQTIHETSSKIGSILCKNNNENLKTGKIYYYKTEDLLKRQEIQQALKMASLSLKEETNLSHSFIVYNPKTVMDDMSSKRIIGSYVHGSHDFRVMDMGKLGLGGVIVELEYGSKEGASLESKVAQQIADEVAIHLYSAKNISNDLSVNALSLPIVRVDKFAGIYSKICGSYLQGTNKSVFNLKEFMRIISEFGISININSAGLLDLNKANLYDFRALKSINYEN